MTNRLHDLAIATLGAGLALGASALLSAAPAAPASLLDDAPPEMRIGMDVVPVMPADSKPPTGQVRQVIGPWVLIKNEDDYWWVNFNQVLLYKSDRR